MGRLKKQRTKLGLFSISWFSSLCYWCVLYHLIVMKNMIHKFCWNTHNSTFLIDNLGKSTIILSSCFWPALVLGLRVWGFLYWSYMLNRTIFFSKLDAIFFITEHVEVPYFGYSLLVESRINVSMHNIILPKKHFASYCFLFHF